MTEGQTQQEESRGATGTLAEFIAGFPGNGIDPAAIAEARLTLANYLGCCIAGSQHETVKRLMAAFSPFFGAPSCSILGRVEKADALNAALVNGTANNVYGFDDTHLETITHPGGPVVSALLALAELHHFSGRELLEAMVIGVEVTCRVARALGPSHVDAGWHVSSTAGTFGAAAAAARVLGLSVPRVARMLAIAGSQPAGLRANFGTMTVSLHIGLAARNGLASALLSGQDFSAHEALLDHADGWGGVLSPDFRPERLVENLGAGFAITRNSYKPYASGIVTHPVIDGCIDLARAHDLRPADVVGIDLLVHPLVHELTGRLPTSALRSKVSVQHAAAVGVARRAGGIAEFGDAALKDAEISRLRGLVGYETDPALARDAASVTLRLTDGRRLQAHVPHARGSEARPMTEADLRQKFLGLTAGVLTPGAAEELFGLCLNAADLGDAARIASRSRPSERNEV